MKILLISCGGTIVSLNDDHPDKTLAKAVDDAAERLIERTRSDVFTTLLRERGAGDVPLLTGFDLFDVDSTEITPDHWKALINKLIESYDNYDGFIITHGTNSLAYTAGALSFGLPMLGKPVVITGSNFPMGPPNSDALFNFANSILLVQKLVLEKRSGIFAAFASRVMPGVRVKKSNGTELEAFRTFNAPDVGQIRPKNVMINSYEYGKYKPQNGDGAPFKNGFQPAKTSAELKFHASTDFPGVISSHTFHPGDDPRTYLAVIKELARVEQAGSRGAIIIRGVGDGDLSKILQNEVLAKAHEARIPVVITTQEPQGTSSLSGNEQSAGMKTVIPAWDMSIEMMVVKLRYLFGKELSYEEIKAEFGKNYLGEINITKS